jgi:hypothetical protein
MSRSRNDPVGLGTFIRRRFPRAVGTQQPVFDGVVEDLCQQVSDLPAFREWSQPGSNR